MSTNIQPQQPSKGASKACLPMAELAEPETTEHTKVESWRLHVLIHAGYSITLAERIAASDADLHLAVELVERGCSHTTAAEILI